MEKNHKYIPALGFDSLTFLYDPVVRLTTRERRFKAALVKLAKLKPRQKVLDVGCGTATLAIALKKACPQATVHGLDGDGRILSIAWRKTQKEKVEVFLEQGFSFDMPYEASSFDCVVSSLFFHHLTPENKKRTLREIWEVLKPNGELYVADWGKPQNLLMRFVSKFIEGLDGATTKDSFQGLLSDYAVETGFDEVCEAGYLNTMFGTIRLLQAKKGFKVL